MVYQQITAGPYCGLFAVHLDEYRGWDKQQEVVDALDKAEANFKLTGAKKVLVMNGFYPPKGDEESAGMRDHEAMALVTILRAKGWFIILMIPGDFYPLHAKMVNYVITFVKNPHGRWLNHATSGIVWIWDGQESEPRIQQHNNGAGLFMQAPQLVGSDILSVVINAERAWQVQGVTVPKVGVEI